MPIHRRQRKILLFLGSALAGCLLLLLALPVWFPWLLRPLSARQDASYSRYERIGAGRFAVYDFSVTNDGVRLRAQRLEAFLPTAWLWRAKMHSRTARSPFIDLQGWQLEFPPTSGGPAATNEPAIFSVFMDVDATLERL